MRYAALVVLAAVQLGSLAWLGGNAWYLRSAGYRDYCGQVLTRALELPSEISHIAPRSLQMRQFDGVRVWLPDRRGVALHCATALVWQRPVKDDPDAYEIEINGGACEISARTWLREDYRHVVEAGLRPGFVEGGPTRVTFEKMDLSFDRDRFRAWLNDASGAINFDSPVRGHAAAFCHEFNGHPSRDPVAFTAVFSPQSAGIRIDRLELTIPRLPIGILGLADLIDADLRSGDFAGRVVYGESDAGRTLRVNGDCEGIELAECFGHFLPQPVRGRCDELELEELRVEERTPVELRFRGVLTDVVLGDLLAPLGFGGVGGRTTLWVREAHLTRDGIERLIATGKCTDISLVDASAALGWGKMSGTLQITISDLTIERNRIASLNAELRVVDSQEKWIEGALLRELVRRTLNVKLPNVLPERIEYSDLGVRADVRDEVLHVFGTHGSREKTILTVVLMGRKLGLVTEPDESFNLRGWLDDLRRRAGAAIEAQSERLPAPARRWFIPTTAPAGTTRPSAP